MPHLDENTKAELLAATLPHLRGARSKGTPSLGAGAIYPIPVEEITIPYFQLPAHFPRCYGMDVGWKKTAALWGAWDRSIDCIYIYAEHYRGLAEPSIHTASIKARGDWIPGIIDPAARGRSQKDGTVLLEEYRALGLHLTEGVNAVDGGILAVWERLATGRIKIFTSCLNFLKEYQLYRRDDKGKVVKEFDHLLDCLRYLVSRYRAVARCRPVEQGKFTPTAIDTAVGY